MFPFRVMQTQINRSKYLHVFVRVRHTKEINKIHVTDDLTRNLLRFSERKVHVSNMA